MTSKQWNRFETKLPKCHCGKHFWLEPCKGGRREGSFAERLTMERYPWAFDQEEDV